MRHQRQHYQISFHKDNNGEYFSRVTRWYADAVQGWCGDSFYGAFVGGKNDCEIINDQLWEMDNIDAYVFGNESLQNLLNFANVWSLTYTEKPYDVCKFMAWKDGICPNIGIVAQDAKLGLEAIKHNLSEYMNYYDYDSQDLYFEQVKKVLTAIRHNNTVSLADNELVE